MLVCTLYDNQGNQVDNENCPFCRTPAPTTNEEVINRLKKRIEAGDVRAMHNLGAYYRDGKYGLPQDYVKALELYHQAGELGYAESFSNIGYAHECGSRGVEVDKEKANHYYELAAMAGDACARHNLGNKEENAGNMERALKHYMIAAGDGFNESVERIKEMYTNGHATKEDYTKALQSYQAYLGEIKSKQRDEAAAAREDCRYY